MVGCFILCYNVALTLRGMNGRNIYIEPHVTQIPLTAFIRRPDMEQLSVDQIEQMLAWAERTLEKLTNVDDIKQMKKDVALLKNMLRKMKRTA